MSTWRDRWLVARWTLAPFTPVLGLVLVLGFVLGLMWLWKGMQ